jgi:hypothetical protein
VVNVVRFVLQRTVATAKQGSAAVVSGQSFCMPALRTACMMSTCQCMACVTFCLFLPQPDTSLATRL